MAMKKISLTKGEFALVDDEDFDYLNKWKWHYCAFYACRSYNKGRKIGMHREILKLYNSDLDVDHIDGNPLNNQKNNLRISTRSENNMNRNKTTRKNSSKYKGLVFYPKRNKFKVTINAHKKTYFIGYFRNEIDAAKAYNTAAIKYHGKFAKLNNV